MNDTKSLDPPEQVTQGLCKIPAEIKKQLEEMTVGMDTKSETIFRAGTEVSWDLAVKYERERINKIFCEGVIGPRDLPKGLYEAILTPPQSDEGFEDHGPLIKKTTAGYGSVNTEVRRYSRTAYEAVEDKINTESKGGRVSELKEESGDNMICPHCGFIDEDSFEHTSDNGTIDCYSCDKPFKYSRVIDVTYYTEEVKEGAS